MWVALAKSLWYPAAGTQLSHLAAHLKAHTSTAMHFSLAECPGAAPAYPAPVIFSDCPDTSECKGLPPRSLLKLSPCRQAPVAAYLHHGLTGEIAEAPAGFS